MPLHGKKTLKTIQNGVDNFESFDVGNVSGDNTGVWRFGRLPIEYRDSVKSASYVIYSYSTPIAWYVDGKWTIPNVSYSRTTSVHQGKIRVATANPGFYS